MVDLGRNRVRCSVRDVVLEPIHQNQEVGRPGRLTSRASVVHRGNRTEGQRRQLPG